MYRERMPMQLLSYLRLARLTDLALLAKVWDCPRHLPMPNTFMHRIYVAQ